MAKIQNMTLKEFIENLNILLEKHPTAIVLNDERYSISVTDTLQSNGTPKLIYDWRAAHEVSLKNDRAAAMQNTYNR